MKFSFLPRKASRHHPEPSAAFQVKRLWENSAGRSVEISHLIDRTYDYSSVRELKWHLSDKFALPVQDVDVARV